VGLNPVDRAGVVDVLRFRSPLFARSVATQGAFHDPGQDSRPAFPNTEPCRPAVVLSLNIEIILLHMDQMFLNIELHRGVLECIRGSRDLLASWRIAKT